MSLCHPGPVTGRNAPWTRPTPDKRLPNLDYIHINDLPYVVPSVPTRLHYQQQELSTFMALDVQAGMHQL